MGVVKQPGSRGETTRLNFRGERPGAKRPGRKWFWGETSCYHKEWLQDSSFHTWSFLRNTYLIFLFRYFRSIEGPNFKPQWHVQSQNILDDSVSSIPQRTVTPTTNLPNAEAKRPVPNFHYDLFNKLNSARDNLEVC